MGDRSLLDSSVGWNGFGRCLGCRKWLHFGMVDRHWLGLYIAVENDLFSVSGSKFTGFSYGWSKLSSFLFGGSNLSWFQCKDRNWLVVCVRAENHLVLVRAAIDLFFVWVVEIALISVWRIELDLISVYEWNWFGCCVAGRISLEMGVLTDRFIGYVVLLLEDHSVLSDYLRGSSLINE